MARPYPLKPNPPPALPAALPPTRAPKKIGLFFEHGKSPRAGPRIPFFTMWRRSGHPRGWTLVELIVVMAIIAVLSTLVITRYAGRTDEAKGTAARAQIEQLKTAVIEFQAKCNRLPNSLNELVQRPSDCPNWPEGGLLGRKTLPKDPWKNEFVFRQESGGFVILSYGADGKEGGTGVNKDISSEEEN